MNLLERFHYSQMLIRNNLVLLNALIHIHEDTTFFPYHLSKRISFLRRDRSMKKKISYKHIDILFSIIQENNFCFGSIVRQRWKITFTCSCSTLTFFMFFFFLFTRCLIFFFSLPLQALFIRFLQFQSPRPSISIIIFLYLLFPQFLLIFSIAIIIRSWCDHRWWWKIIIIIIVHHWFIIILN